MSLFLFLIFIDDPGAPASVLEINVADEERNLVRLVKALPDIFRKFIDIALDGDGDRGSLKARDRVSVIDVGADKMPAAGERRGVGEGEAFVAVRVAVGTL